MNGTDWELLAQYTGRGVEEAFAEIVRRHLNLVYSTALRHVHAPQLAEEVAQSVFCELAHCAPRLKTGSVLAAWLYRVAYRKALNAARGDTRRQLRERLASEMNTMTAPADEWRHVEPLLDEAMHALEEPDRMAVLLRFFENQPLREVGLALGTSEDAAQKRVARALERLRDFYARRGVAVGAGGVAALLSMHAVQAAPPGLAAAVSATAVAGTAWAGTTAAKVIAMTTLQKTLLTAAFVITVGTTVYQSRLVSGLRDEVRTLQAQRAPLAEQVAQLSRANVDLSNRLARVPPTLTGGTERLRELLRLRGEIGPLRQRQRELEQALAAAQARAPGLVPDQVGAATKPPIVPAPFQMQLVLDGPGEESLAMTNSVSGDGGETVHVLKTPLLDHTAIRSAMVTRNAAGAAEIQIEFSPEGRELLAGVTKEHLNQRLALVLDGHLYAAPVIREEISGGRVQITGNFTEQEAFDLAAKLNEAVTRP